MADREGPHFGKGPRGWTRSDTRLAEEVSDRLMEDRLLDARGITVAVDGATVSLTGDVPGASDAAHAEMLARGTAGVGRVENHLRYEPGQRAVDRMGPAPEAAHYEGRWGRWVPPFST